MPYHRYFYADHSSIVLVRSEGRMLASVLRAGDDGDGEAVTLTDMTHSHPDVEHHLRHVMDLEGDALLARMLEVLTTWTDKRFVDSSVQNSRV